MRDMIFGIIAGVVLAFILSFFDVDSWVMLHLIPDFLLKTEKKSHCKQYITQKGLHLF